MFTTPSHHSSQGKSFPTRMNLRTIGVFLLVCVLFTRRSQAFLAQNAGTTRLFGLMASRTDHIGSLRQAKSSSEAGSSNDSLNVMTDSVRNFIAATLFSFALTISPVVNPSSPSRTWFAVNAEEPQVTLQNSDQIADVGVAEGGSQQSLLTTVTPDNDSTVVEQVWTLVSKYFIDQTFNGQDWNEVKQNFLSQTGPNDGDDKSMQLVTKMAATLGDKYSRILNVDQYQAIQKYDLIGIGATLMPDQQKHIIVGAPPVPGSASDKAGLKVGDYIVAVNGIPTDGRSAFDLIDQISENPNAQTISMTVRTPTGGDSLTNGVTRDITMPRAFAAVKNPIEYKVSETRKDGIKVGYVRISEFNGIVKARLEDALNSLEKGGANAYVIDVRGNPGGAFQSAVEISSLFIDDRVATYVVDSNHFELPFRTAAGRVIVDPQDPIAIWVDRNSASASEVFAGSLHDNCRAVVMGENSFGKGKIQAVYGLKNGGGLVLTVAKYITPSGTDIQGAGIKPDIEVNLPPSLIPVISSDTSKVDFADISQRLSMCQVPDVH